MTGVPGTTVFPAAVGHGRPGARVGYAELAADLRATADEHNATAAVGISLGAHTLLRLLAETPDRFAKVVLLFPAALDRAVVRPAGLTEALVSKDAAAVETWVRAGLAPGLQGRTVEAYVRARTSFMLASDLVPLIEGIANDVPVVDRSALRGVLADVLVIGQQDDPVHPVAAAAEVASAIPRAELVVLGPGAAFREGASLRSKIIQVITAPKG